MLYDYECGGLETPCTSPGAGRTLLQVCQHSTKQRERKKQKRLPATWGRSQCAGLSTVTPACLHSDGNRCEVEARSGQTPSLPPSLSAPFEDSKSSTPKHLSPASIGGLTFSASFRVCLTPPGLRDTVWKQKWQLPHKLWVAAAALLVALCIMFML